MIDINTYAMPPSNQVSNKAYQSMRRQPYTQYSGYAAKADTEITDSSFKPMPKDDVYDMYLSNSPGIDYYQDSKHAKKTSLIHSKKSSSQYLSRQVKR